MSKNPALKKLVSKKKSFFHNGSISPQQNLLLDTPLLMSYLITTNFNHSAFNTSKPGSNYTKHFIILCQKTLNICNVMNDVQNPDLP